MHRLICLVVVFFGGAWKNVLTCFIVVSHIVVLILFRNVSVPFILPLLDANVFLSIFQGLMWMCWVLLLRRLTQDDDVNLEDVCLTRALTIPISQVFISAVPTRPLSPMTFS